MQLLFSCHPLDGIGIPVSRGPLLMEYGIRENFHLCNSESRKFCLWDPESRALESVIKLKEFGIPLTIETEIQYLESGIHGVESRM